MTGGVTGVERLRAGVVVIGAGAVGLAAAVELRRGGVSDVLVIEAHGAAGQGATSRANGGVRAQFSTEVNIAFSRFTIDALAELDRETGGLVGLRRNGYLFMVGSEASEQSLRRGYTLQRSLGVNVQWLSSSEVLGMVPFVRAEGLRAGTYCADDGIIDPHGVVSALCLQARQLGIRLMFGERVVGVDGSSRSLCVRTERAAIDSDYVVNAAGPYAAAVAAMAGETLPVEPYRRNLACTEPVSGFPDPIPMCVDLDTGVLIRREAGGFILGYHDPQDPPCDDTRFDPAFLDALCARVGNRFPFLEDVPIDRRKCWAGLYPETPDHTAIIDTAANHPRLIHCAGFGGHGIMHSMAAGRAVAELIRDGRCTTFDITPLRLARFAEEALTVETAVL